MKHIIIINGYGTSGKDKFVDLFHRHIELYQDVLNVSTIDLVKETSKVFGWNGKTKGEAERLFWSEIKAAVTKYGDTINDNIIDTIRIKNPNYVFVHIREPKEIIGFIDKAKKLYGHETLSVCKISTLLIKRKGVLAPDNPSDKAVLDYDYNYEISNDGNLIDLNDEALNFYREITK